MTLLEFGILTTAAQYVLGGARITAPLYKRLPNWLRIGVECQPCCGTWLGLAAHFAGLAPSSNVPLNMAAGMVLTAVGRSLMSLGYTEDEVKQ